MLWIRANKDSKCLFLGIQKGEHASLSQIQRALYEVWDWGQGRGTQMRLKQIYIRIMINATGEQTHLQRSICVQFAVVSALSFSSLIQNGDMQTKSQFLRHALNTALPQAARQQHLCPVAIQTSVPSILICTC